MRRFIKFIFESQASLVFGKRSIDFFTQNRGRIFINSIFAIRTLRLLLVSNPLEISFLLIRQLLKLLLSSSVLSFPLLVQLPPPVGSLVDPLADVSEFEMGACVGTVVLLAGLIVGVDPLVVSYVYVVVDVFSLVKLRTCGLPFLLWLWTFLKGLIQI
jgi:hypothetical protein